jgi:S-adenosylmethionine:tRNA-ribosyltransferase-isomerase (queuine synthetase)
MALEKQTVVDLIEVLENGTVQVRTATRIIEDGIVLSSSLHRHVVVPGDDYSQEDAKVQAICAVIQTADVIAAYQAAIEAAQPVALEV